MTDKHPTDALPMPVRPLGLTDPNYTITFYKGDYPNEKQVGRLDFNGPEMKFEGNAEESAKVFFEFLAEKFAGRLDAEHKAGRESMREEAAKIFEARITGELCYVGEDFENRQCADSIRSIEL